MIGFTFCYLQALYLSLAPSTRQNSISSNVIYKKTCSDKHKVLMSHKRFMRKRKTSTTKLLSRGLHSTYAVLEIIRTSWCVPGNRFFATTFNNNIYASFEFIHQLLHSIFIVLCEIKEKEKIYMMKMLGWLNWNGGAGWAGQTFAHPVFGDQGLMRWLVENIKILRVE